MLRLPPTSAIIVLALLPARQPREDIRDLKLRDWQPKSMMVTKETRVEKPAFPVIDIHNHLGGGKGWLTPDRVNKYLAEMDAAGVRTVIDLDGGWDSGLVETIEALEKTHPGRFCTFANVNFDNVDDPVWSNREAKRLEAGVKAGVRAVTLSKNFDLG